MIVTEGTDRKANTITIIHDMLVDSIRILKKCNNYRIVHFSKYKKLTHTNCRANINPLVIVFDRLLPLCPTPDLL